ncbi:MAG TPA: four helix bundle protein [Thermoanaerobaculia bacterium]|jgi:four helix bundle protein|nr:four helix bundle protein [Thermoanaerobaculia bacterium]
MKDHRELPAFQHTHELVLAVHEAASQLPGHDPSALGARMEAAAHSAAAAVARSCAVPPEQFGGQMDEASRRLREVAYYIDIAQRLGHLTLDTAVELLERQTLAGVEVNALLQQEEGSGGVAVLSWEGEEEPQPVDGSPMAVTSSVPGR